MLRIVVAVAVIVAALATSAEAQRPRMPLFPLSMTFERGADQQVTTLNVEVRNVENGPVCVSADYAGPTRLVMTLEPAREIAPLQAGEAAPSGCVELAHGATLTVSYDVQALFPDQSLDEPRLCYSLPTRRGLASDSGDLTLLWSACSQARR